MRDCLAYERVRTRHSGAIISLAGDPFGGLLILRDLSRVSGEPEPSLRGGYVTVPNENSVWRAGGFT